VLKIISGDMEKMDTGCLIIPVCENQAIHDDPAVLKLTTAAKRFKEFKGKKGESLLLYDPGKIYAKRALFLGLGKFEKLNSEGLRAAAGRGIRQCIERHIPEALICAPLATVLKLQEEAMLEALLEGAFLGNHLFDRYKNEKKDKPLTQVSVYAKPDQAKAYGRLPARVETVCGGTVLAREWVSMPPNDKRPDRFSQLICKALKKEKIKITVLDANRLRRHRMSGILAVGAGSCVPPRMLILDYHPGSPAKAKKNKQTVVLLGKGVTFDSGGINLKPSTGLEDMKTDMSGAAAVAATLLSAARLKAGYRIIGVIPVVENMPSGDASRPGDIITSHAGKTVEIGNTDAEGRLILIDAMSYAVKMYHPDVMIDMATLTGACVVALGEKIAGVFSSDAALRDVIVAAGETTHERCWPMPMPEDYKELLKSDFADIKNISSSRWGGAITAALFLSEFVGKARWAHIDIAGPAYSAKDGPYCRAGGTGFGVRLMMEVLNRLS